MKASRTPIVLLLALYAAFAGSLIYGAGVLPERVASHFGLRGEANAWMSRDANLIFFAVISLVPLLIVGLSYVTRYFPVGLVNLPRRDYWLAPERRLETYRYIWNHSLWLASLNLALLVGLNFMVIEANRHQSVRLPMPWFAAMMAGFIVGTVAWGWGLFRHFKQTSTADVP